MPKLSTLRAIVLVCLFTPPALAQGTRLEVVELRHREAAELIPIVKPMLSPQATLVADGYRLLVKGTPADIAQLQSLVATLDARLRNLLIDVRTVRHGDVDDRSSSVQVTVGEESSVRIEGSRTSTRARDTNGFQVRAIEGQPALVQVGEQQPAYPGVITIVGGHVVPFGGQGERSARSGVYVTARVRGETVMLDIAPALQRFAGDGTRRTYSAAATLTGAVGRWITIASVDTVGSSEARGAAGHQTRSGTHALVTQVKVTVLD